MRKRPPQLQLDLPAPEFHDSASMPITQQNTPHVGMLVFKLEGGCTRDDADVLEKLSWLASVVEDWSHYKVTFCKIREDPTKIMLLSGWNSVEEHYQGLHQSPDMGAVLAEFGGVVDVRSSWHVDIPFKSIDVDAPLITVMRAYVYKAKSEEFEKLLPAWDANFSEYAGSDVLLGWRHEGVGWDDQDNYINHKADYDIEDDQEASEQNADDAETRELNVIVSWPSLEKWQETQGEKEKRKPFLQVLKSVARLEVWHLQKMDVPKYNEEDADDDDEDEDDDE